MKPAVLIAQAIFAIIGVFFTFIGLMGQLTFRPSMWYSGPQPIVLIFIGLPFIAASLLLTTLHKKEKEELGRENNLLQMALRCPNCNSLNNATAKFCNDCGSQLPNSHIDY